MNDPTIPVEHTESLADLAARVRTNAERLGTERTGEDRLRAIEQRLADITALSRLVEDLLSFRQILSDADLRPRTPKRRLSAKLKSVNKLKAAAAANITALTQPRALEIDDAREVLREIHDGFVTTWRDFAKPPKVTSGLETLAALPELRDTAQKMLAALARLDDAAKAVPNSAATVALVVRSKTELADLNVKLLAHGYGDEILAFLAQARTSTGVPLARVLTNPTVLAWLEVGDHAASFRLVYESVVVPSSYRL
jgi:hypothetical protein